MTHPLRRPRLALIYKHAGNLCTLPILLGHTKIAGAVRYLGNDAEGSLVLAEGVEI